MRWWPRGIGRQIFGSSAVVAAKLSFRPSPVWCEDHKDGNYLRPMVGSATTAANLENEDRFRIVEKNGRIVAVVADGHGGHQVSDFVCNRLPDELVGGHIHVTDAFVNIDNEIREVVNRGDGQILCYEGSCAIAAIVTKNSVTVANAGDSRCLLIHRSRLSDLPGDSGDGDSTEDCAPPGTEWLSDLHTADNISEQIRLRSLHPLERDVVHCRQKIVEMDSITGAVVSTKWGACYVKGRLQPTRAFGDFYLKEKNIFCPPEVASDIIPPPLFTPPYIEVTPTVYEVPREPGDILVMGTDGLWDYCSPRLVRDVISEGVSTGRNPEQLANDLIETALMIASDASEVPIDDLKCMQRGFERRNIHDDITVVVISF